MTIRSISLSDAGVLGDANSAARNGLNASKGLNILPDSISKLVTPFANGSSILGGVLLLPIAGSLVKNGFTKAKESYSLGNIEGVAHNALWGVTGLNLAGVGGLLTANGALGFANVAAPAALTTAFCGLGLGMNGAMGIYGAYGLNEARKFGNELDSRTDEEAVKWLNSQATLNDNEIAKCNGNVGKMNKILKKKLNALELRVGVECAKKIGEKLPLNIKVDKAFIQEVKKANFKQQVKFALLILLAVVGTAAVIAMMVSTGPASPIIFALGAALWLTVDSSKLHSYIGEKLWTWHCDVKKAESICQKTHSISQKTIS